MRKKILIYTMIMKKGGTELSISNVVNKFIDKYDIVLVTNINHKSEYVLDKRIKYINIDSKDRSNEFLPFKLFTKLSLKRSKELKKIIETEKPNLMIGFLPEPTIRLLAMKKYFPNIPILFSIRNHPKNEFKLPFLKKIRDYYYNMADGIIVQDASYIKHLSKIEESKFEVIENYISREFTKIPAPSKRRKVIVTVSRLAKQKNIEMLIDAFYYLGEDYDEYKLHIIGTGKWKNRLEAKIKKLNLEDRVILKGKVKDVVNEIKNDALFVLSSYYEGMPNSLLEAMSLSLPVISTLSSEVIPNIIKDNVNGIIVGVDDVGMLVEKMKYLLDNPTIAEKMGIEASNIQTTFCESKMVKKWENIIKKHMR